MVLIWGLAAQNVSALISVDTVYVGDIGNPSDWTGRGAVDYGYSIGKYEVTVSQYAAFLNAVAKTDTYGLYNSIMGFDGDISRSGVSGSYGYTVVGDPNKPINYVSWFDAARFVNWLGNGQPTGLQGSGTTETGAYTLNGATSGVNFTKNAGAQYWIPSDAEWYKAAYYQPTDKGGDSDSYWLYPTRSNNQPNSRDGSVTDPNSANFYYNDGIANGYNGGYAVNDSTTSPYPDGRTDVGAFSLASSYYGTFDQGGNLDEWDDFTSGGGRATVGGDWGELAGAMQAGSYYNVGDPAGEFGNVGFRIATIPEPAGLGVCGLIVTGCFLLRWRR